MTSVAALKVGVCAGLVSAGLGFVPEDAVYPLADRLGLPGLKDIGDVARQDLLLSSLAVGVAATLGTAFAIRAGIVRVIPERLPGTLGSMLG